MNSKTRRDKKHLLKIVALIVTNVSSLPTQKRLTIETFRSGLLFQRKDSGIVVNPMCKIPIPIQSLLLRT